MLLFFVIEIGNKEFGNFGPSDHVNQSKAKIQKVKNSLQKHHVEKPFDITVLKMNLKKYIAGLLNELKSISTFVTTSVLPQSTFQHFSSLQG